MEPERARYIFRDDIPTWMFRNMHEGEGVVPTTLNAMIIERATWEEYTRRAEIFYQQYSDEDIARYNQQNIERLYAERQSPQVVTQEQYKEHSFVYLIRDELGYYKIGLSKDPEKRKAQLERSTPHTLTLIHTFPANHAKIAEEALHGEFASKRVKGEWFALDEDDVAWLCSVEGYDDGTFHANY